MRHVAAGLAVFLFAAPAAALTQPNGMVIPTALGCDGGKPDGLAAVFACVCTTANVCNIGAVCPIQGNCPNGQNATCETTLWHNFNDNTCIPSNLSGLDPVAEASTLPETFHPSCPLTFDLLSRGTALFQNAFGWYNVTGAAPPSSDLHVIQDCGEAPGQSVTLDLASQPAYKGGDVGFFLVTPESAPPGGSCAQGNCCATVARATTGQGHIYYSELAYNPDFIGPSSYIHLLVYNSHLNKQKFYFAWEDTYGTPSGDFTDFVAGVSGIQCSGGGASCDTGKLGVCALGIDICTLGVLGCSELFQPSGELCNGLDDDCDGQIDQGAVCPSGEICHDGACVQPCSAVEFPCVPGTACESASGLCVDPACVGKSCASGEVCTAGMCRMPCQGVVCPQGQECIGDACVDLCKGVTCNAGQTCHEGKCFSGCDQCDGIACAMPLTCDGASGQCTDPSCPAGCPAGTLCASGQCADGCAGVLCPPGQSCSGGECKGGSAAQGTGGFSGFGGAGHGMTTGAGGVTAGAGGVGGAGQGGQGGAGSVKSKAGCGCELAEEPGAVGTRFAGIALAALAGMGSRRRSRRRSSAGRVTSR